MKVRDLLTVLRTDSVILTRGQEILVDCETSHIEQKLEKYMDEEIADIVPLNCAMEINLKQCNGNQKRLEGQYETLHITK